MSDKHPINHLQKQSLHYSYTMPSHFSTRPDPSNITGHKVLIFHSSQYRVAVNRIYARLSMFQGGLPLPPLSVLSGSCHPQTGHTHTVPVGSSYLREKTWKLAKQADMKFVLVAVWIDTGSRRGESKAVALFLWLTKDTWVYVQIIWGWNMSPTWLWYTFLTENCVSNQIKPLCYRQ